jgi:hypothetical protein
MAWEKTRPEAYLDHAWWPRYRQSTTWLLIGSCKVRRTESHGSLSRVTFPPASPLTLWSRM